MYLLSIGMTTIAIANFLLSFINVKDTNDIPLEYTLQLYTHWLNRIILKGESNYGKKVSFSKRSD